MKVDLVFVGNTNKKMGEGRGVIYKGVTCSKGRAAIQELEYRDQHSQDLARCEVSN